ncbi:MULTISPECIES: cytochrome ubiquinol oxidase subunit II [unclassified Sphingomonas]|jgi:cytochrome o ubiquinol oxidase subunit II|uniref:cytochrome ubiquinol oxidase subunit II n=1 Tax=unclassified Sphingomonas TaxID=196159 RepID=UPI001E5D9D63|nr:MULTISPECIES: cytochrome ubiquinol oxidase subunit II [unclassified Sphingomonas]
MHDDHLAPPRVRPRMRHRLGMRFRPLFALAILSALSGCAALDHGILNAQGPVAADERHLLLVVSGILLFVWVPVVLLVPAFAWHYRRSNTRDAYRPDWGFSWVLEGFIWIPPVAIVVLLAFLAWPATVRDDPYARLPGRGPPVRIQAIALDWKWVFVYPDQGIATVNQLAVPAGRPVAVELTSGTVMQSLLLPQLAGQVYAMGGMRTHLHFAADRPGRYLGENVQFNGDRFAQQRFAILALTADDYAAWLSRARSRRRPLDAAAWAALSRRGTSDVDVFSAVPRGFFDHIVATTGGGAQPHHAAHPALRKAS